MSYKFVWIVSLLGLALLGSGASVVRADETYRLLENTAAGDACQSEDDFSMNLTLTVVSEGKTVLSTEFSSNEQKKYHDEVLKVDADGRATAIRRRYSVARSTEKDNSGEKTKVSTLQGKTVVIRRIGAKASVKCESGTISDQDSKSLLDDVMPRKGHLFPNHPLAVGEEWTPDPASLAGGFPGAKKAVLRGKLVEIVSYAGHRCAHIHLSLDLEMPFTDKVAGKMKLEGEGYQALDIQRPLTLSLSGPVTAQGAETKDGVEFTYSGEGTAHMKLVAFWEKVGGKPIAASHLP